MQLFKKTKQLEEKTHRFLMNIDICGDLFLQAFQLYLKSGDTIRFKTLQKEIDYLERENDSLRREVENQLYSQMLLPDMRSDILALIEGCDKIINKYQTDITLLSIECPGIPTALKKEISDLIKTNISCVHQLIEGLNAVLGGRKGSDFIQEVYHLEHRADLQAIALKEKVFQKMRLPLARQLQLREFIYGIEKISDMAEDMADMLSVFGVKHAV